MENMEINFFDKANVKNSAQKRTIKKNNHEKCIFIRPPKILIVEDIQMLQRLNMMNLASIGCNPELAKDGATALEMFKNNYDLILSDIGLPDKNGKEVAKAIRFYENKSGCKRNILIALTAQNAELEKCMECGFDDFYVKPLLLEPMKELLKRWLPHLVNPPKQSVK
jgi:CheY-like chemotaxis protein